MENMPVRAMVAHCIKCCNGWIVKIFEERLLPATELSMGVSRSFVSADTCEDAIRIAQGMKTRGEVHSYKLWLNSFEQG
jgi:hypothetical protein